jgi:hypothetical protein
MNSEYVAFKNYGAGKLFDTFNAGLPLQPLFQKAAGHLLGGVPGPLVGMLESTLKISRTFTHLGVVFQTEDGQPYDATETIVDFQCAANAKDGAKMSECLSSVVFLLERLRAALPPGTKLALNDQQPVTTQPATPIPVTVVGMPQRETSTQIERDASGAIVASTQVERDMVPSC